MRCAAAAALVLLTSCMSLLAPMPPGFKKSGGAYRADFPEGTPPEVKYAVMECYLSQNSAAIGPKGEAVAAELNATRDQMFRRWAETMLQRGAPLVKLKDGIPELLPLVFSQTLGTEQGLLKVVELLDLSRNGMEFDIPVEMATSPAIWRRSKSQREMFLAWARRVNNKIHVADPKEFDREAFVALLERLKLLLEAKGRIVELCDAYEKAETVKPSEKQEYLKKLLDSFTDVKKGLPEDVSFDIIGDTSTLPRFQTILSKLPERCMEFTMSFADSTMSSERERLRRLGTTSDTATEEVLTAVETGLSKALGEISGDERFAATLKNGRERIDSQVDECARLRMQLWKDRLDALDAKGEFWSACREFDGFIKSLDDGAKGQFNVYFTRYVPGPSSRTFADAIKDGATEVYLAVLGHAYERYFQRAEDALNVSQKYGVCFAVASLLERMSTLPHGCTLSDELRRRLEAVRALKDGARTRIVDKVLKRTISIADMTSDVPGIGLTYSRDLENELKATLKSFGMENQVVFPENASDDFKWSYVVFDGRVANFDGNELTERQATMTRKMFGEGIRVDNPAFDPEAPENAPKEKRSKVKYLQDESLRVIHIKEVERLAHLRIFMNFRGLGVTRRIEVNEFYSRIFSIEESHPFDDVKLIAKHEYYDAMSLQPVSPEPTLRYDRIWTAGEMLDWARKDSLKLASLKLFHHINDYPLYLKEKSDGFEAAGKTEEALEALSHCLIQCQLQDSGGEAIAHLSSSEPPAAKEYGNALDSLNRQIRAISELKEKVPERLFDLANSYLIAAM